MFFSVASLGLMGIEPYIVSVEADCRRGMPGFDVVGLPDAAVRESRDRVKSAAPNLGYKLPDKKLVINLAPADTKKQGSVYDLPMLLALLCAAGLESFKLEGTAVIGEMSLSGELRGLVGVLPMVLGAKALGLSRVIVPEQNAAEASAAEDVEVLAARHAGDVIRYLRGKGELRAAGDFTPAPAVEVSLPDLADVKGQLEAKRALEIAAAGGHNLLMLGYNVKHCFTNSAVKPLSLGMGSVKYPSTVRD